MSEIINGANMNKAGVYPGWKPMSQAEHDKITIEPLTVTENDTYTAESGKAYSPVTVNVEPPFPYKIVHVIFTPPEDAVQTIVSVKGYYDSSTKRVTSGPLYFNETAEQRFDVYVTSIEDIGEDGVHDFRWIFAPSGNSDLYFECTTDGEAFTGLNIDWSSCIFENCTYNDDWGYVFLSDAGEATVTIAFEDSEP